MYLQIKKFGEKDSENGFAMDSLFTVDEAALQKAFGLTQVR